MPCVPNLARGLHLVCLLPQGLSRMRTGSVHGSNACRVWQTTSKLESVTTPSCVSNTAFTVGATTAPDSWDAPSTHRSPMGSRHPCPSLRAAKRSAAAWAIRTRRCCARMGPTSSGRLPGWHSLRPRVLRWRGCPVRDSCPQVSMPVRAAQSRAGVPASKHQRQQHAAACRSMPQRQILGAVGGGFEACRSMPQRAKIFTWWTFLFITCQTLEPFVALRSQNWMVAQWSMYQVTVRKVLGSILGMG